MTSAIMLGGQEHREKPKERRVFALNWKLCFQISATGGNLLGRSGPRTPATFAYLCFNASSLQRIFGRRESVAGSE
jgi:hypothetical protein